MVEELNWSLVSSGSKALFCFFLVSYITWNAFMHSYCVFVIEFFAYQDFSLVDLEILLF